MALPFEWKPKPTFRTQYEKEKYWGQMRELWVNGNGVMTGEHIFYMQECRIKTTQGKIIRPTYRECDLEFFHAYSKAKKDGYDLMLVKRRRIGFSTMVAALTLHTALLNPNSNCLVTSADENRRKGLFDDKIVTTFDLLDDDIRPDKARTKQQGYLYLAKEDRAAKTFSGLKSKIIGLDTVKNPQAFEGYGALLIVLDEIFIHPKANVAAASAMSSMMEDTQKTGIMIIGGTAGDSTQRGVEAGKSIYTSSKENKTYTLFLGGDRGMAEFMTDGVDDIDKAREWINRRREELARADDKTKYFKFLTDYPLTVEEVFNLVTDCALPQELQIVLNDAEKKIETEKIVLGKYSMQSDSVKVIANPDALKGKVNILFPPQKGHIYIMGVDPIPFGNNSLGEGSEMSGVVFDDTTKEIAADYTERSFDSQVVVRNLILLQRLYKSDMFPHGAPAMLELNRGEVVLKEYLALGMDKLLAPMPLHLGIVYEERKFPFGIYMNNQIAARCEALCMKFLLAHGYKLRHKRAIQEFRYLSTKTNTDVLDAIKMALLFSEELMEMKKKQTPVYTNHKIVQLTRNPTTNKLEKREIESSILQR